MILAYIVQSADDDFIGSVHAFDLDATDLWMDQLTGCHHTAAMPVKLPSMNDLVLTFGSELADDHLRSLLV